MSEKRDLCCACICAEILAIISIGRYGIKKSEIGVSLQKNKKIHSASPIRSKFIRITCFWQIFVSILWMKCDQKAREKQYSERKPRPGTERTDHSKLFFNEKKSRRGVERDSCAVSGWSRATQLTVSVAVVSTKCWGWSIQFSLWGSGRPDWNGEGFECGYRGGALEFNCECSSASVR